MQDEELFLPILLGSEDKSSAFKNCIRKNYQHIRKWAKRTQTNCFRIYDREIHHYPLAIDFYAGRFCVQYFCKTHKDQDFSDQLMQETEKVLYQLFQASADNIYWRHRIKRSKLEQYEKISHTKEFFTVFEYGVRFQANLLDYLDTGLFLDHREMRQYVTSHAKDKRVLNLFSYTGSFSVHAAVKGAIFTKSVDMSNTYNAWAEDNFVLNHLSLKQNVVIRADCLKFLDEERASRALYDIIIIDPPTLSRSKKMDQMFDIQLDYVSLISKALRLLKNEGVLFFSTNLRSFVFDLSHFSDCLIYNISKKTMPIDFSDTKIHSCWQITRASVQTKREL
jgi:23S rRNA (cytosine1962-C5)-methyltransferase